MMQHSDRERLQKELAETRQHVAELEARLEKVMAEEQHQMVDDLDQHFDAVETRFRGLRDFLKSVFESKES